MPIAPTRRDRSTVHVITDTLEMELFVKVTKEHLLLRESTSKQFFIHAHRKSGRHTKLNSFEDYVRMLRPAVFVSLAWEKYIDLDGIIGSGFSLSFEKLTFVLFLQT